MRIMLAIAVITGTVPSLLANVAPGPNAPPWPDFRKPPPAQYIAPKPREPSLLPPPFDGPYVALPPSVTTAPNLAAPPNVTTPFPTNTPAYITTAPNPPLSTPAQPSTVPSSQPAPTQPATAPGRPPLGFVASGLLVSAALVAGGLLLARRRNP